MLKFHASQGVLSHNSNLQPIDFYRQRAERGKFLISGSFCYKEIKGRTILEREGVIENGEVKVIKLQHFYGSMIK